jgi:hypothetical protein
MNAAPPIRTRRRLLGGERLLLLAVTLLAFALRAWGTTYGFPLPDARPDEDRWVRVGLGLLEDPDPRWFQWPTLHAYMLAVLYAAWGGVQILRGEFPNFHAYMNEDQSVYLADLVFLGRLLSAVIGALVVPVMWTLARRLGQPASGLWAGFFIAVSFGPVRDGHWALIEPLLLLGIAVTLWATVVAVERGTPASFAIAGLLAGLTTSAKYSGITLAAPIALAVLLVRMREGRSAVGTLWDKRAWLAGLTTLAGFFAGSPFILISTRQFYEAMVVREWSYRDASFGTEPGFIHHLVFSLRYSHGLLMELAGLVGIAAFGFRPAGRAVVSVYLISTYLALGPARIVPMRYGCSLAPAVVLGAAWLIEWMASRRGGRPRVPAVLALAMAVEPIYRCVRFDMLLTRTDTRAEAVAWFAAHVPPGTPVLTRDSKALRWARPPLEDRYELEALPEDASRPAETEAKVERLASEGGVAYVLLQETFTGYAPFAPHLHDIVRRRGALAVSFDPHSPRARPVYDPHDAFFVPVAGFDGVRQPGPRLTIYRLITAR